MPENRIILEASLFLSYPIGNHIILILFPKDFKLVSSSSLLFIYLPCVDHYYYESSLASVNPYSMLVPKWAF